MTRIVFFLLMIFLTSGNFIPADNSEAENYLRKNWKSPENYVISKFDDHDYIFIGEYHRIRHDAELILKLIPMLHEKGINNLGIEFGCYRDQHLVDSLLDLPVFNRELARNIMFLNSPFWGYKEYIDIYETAWKVNHNRKKGEERFRVVNLSAYWDPCKPGGPWKETDPDKFMADVVLKEFVSKHQKALIYSGSHHAFTRYHQPLYNFKTDSLWGFNKTRMGNIIYDSLKNKTFNIYLHAGWVSDQGWDSAAVLPVNGSVDSLMRKFGNKPVGFDVINSPFAKLKSTDSYYKFGYDNFTLDDFCDGYIYTTTFDNYQPITMEKNFITSDNIDIVKKKMKCIGISDERINSLTPENANVLLFEDIRNHFQHLTNKK